MKKGRGGGGKDTRAADARAFGADESQINKFQTKVEDERFLVRQSSWPAVQLFLRLSTQWKMIQITTDEGVFYRATGLDYTAVKSLMWMLRIKRTEMLIDDLQTLENTALEEMTK